MASSFPSGDNAELFDAIAAVILIAIE